MRRILSLLLVLSLCLGMVPGNVWAEEVEPAGETAEVADVTEMEIADDTSGESAEEGDDAAEETEIFEEETTAPTELTDESEPLETHPETDESAFLDAKENSGQCGDTLYWSIDAAGVLTISGNGRMWDYKPLYDDELEVDCSSAPWAALEPKELNLEQGITYIGRNAFYGCESLEGSLMIPNGVKKVGSSAFGGCSGFDGRLSMPESLVSIGSRAFLDCDGFTGELHFPKEMEEIGWGAFRGCSGFTGNLIIPDNVQTIGQYAFYRCNGFNGSLNLPEGLNNIGPYAFSGCEGLSGNLELPDQLAYIGAYSFSNCPNLGGALVIPDAVKQIGEGAFFACSGFSGRLIISKRISQMGVRAFFWCREITSVEIPEGVTFIADEVFSGCSKLSDVYYHGLQEQWNLVTIGDGNEPLLSAQMHFDSGTSAAAGSCGDGLTWFLDDYGTLTIGGKGAMMDYSQNNGAPWRELELNSVVFRGTVTHIGSYAFENCRGLKGLLSLPSSLTSIGQGAFAGCSALTAVKLYESVADINANAFLNCSELRNILFQGEQAQWNAISIGEGNDALVGANINCGIGGECGEDLFWVLEETGTLRIFGTGEMDNFGSGTPWSTYRNQITGVTLDSGVTSVGNNAFFECERLETVTFPDGLERIGEGAFNGCANLREAWLPDSVACIEDDAFRCCFGLEKLILPNGLTHINDGAFDACKSLKMLEIPDSVVTIGNNAFMGCKGIETLTLPLGVEKIGDSAFCGCWNLSGDLILPDSLREIGCFAFSETGFEGKLILPQNLETLGGGAFECCSGFTGDLILPDSLHGIYDGTFGNCTGMTGELKLPKNLESIGDWAFYNCGFTGNLNLPDTLTSIGYAAFQGCRGFSGDLIIPEKMTAVGKESFADCSGFDGALVLPSNLQCVDDNAFFGCRGFSGSVTIPESVEIIGSGAFSAVGVDEFLLSGNSQSFYTVDGILYSLDKTTLLACPGSKKGKIEISEGTEGISDLAFYGCGEITAISVPVSVEQIGEYAFDDCTKLRDVYYGGKWEQWQQICGKEQLSDQKLHLSYSILYKNVPEELENPNPAIGTTDDSIILKDLVRQGYRFAGWFNAEAGGIKVVQIADGNTEDITLYARWQAITYNIRYTPNGGTGKMPDQKGILYGEAAELSPCAFTRKGYRFTGWNTKANGTGETVEEALNLTDANNGTVTLYAQWEGEAYEVTFHFGEETHTQTLHYGTAETLEGNSFENPGYTFKGWNTKETGKGKSYKDGAKVTNLADADLYAQWTANKYTVVFHSNAAKDTVKKQTLTYDATETALTANSFSWKGHAFQGWTTEDGKTFANKEKVRNLTTEQTVDLYAVWKVNEYTVVFDPNGAEGEEVIQAMTYDEPTELTENRFGRQGYTFSGWATTAKGKAAYTDGKEVKNLTDKDGVTVRLYAVWTPTTYTVNFDSGEGATGTMKPVKMTYGKTYTLTGVSFKRSNYTFTGWRDAETWETYANKAKVQDLSADGGTVTLVAQWVPAEYAVTYKNLSTWEQENLTKSYNVLSEGMPGEPSRPGCEFAGWFLDSSCKKPFTGFENIAKPGKLTLYPKWTGTPSKYTIHFAPGADGVTGKMADKKNLVCGKDYTLAGCAFKRPGWQFAGWECGSTVLDNKAKFSNLPAYLKDFASGGTVTLTAKWVKNTAK